MSKELLIKIVLAVFICLAVGGIGGYATASSVQNWYTTLQKPSFNPPNWLFGPVWTLLYTLMGIATGLVWNQMNKNPLARIALRFFGVQLILNCLWSFSFFYFENPLLGLINIVFLIIFIFITIKWYARVHKWASYLLYPYMAWVCFATVLNFNLWVLN